MSIDRNEYLAIHAYIRYKFGKANQCENPNCKHESKRFEWALKKGKQYQRLKENFIMLCKRCHNEYDGFKPEPLHSTRNYETMQRIQMAKFKPVDQFSRHGEFVRTWDSATHAEQELKISRKAIYNNIYNLSKTAGGFVWRING